MKNIEDDFIGSKFLTPVGSEITVISRERINSVTKYIVECSICSKDKELFPEQIKITKNKLLTGRIPCGCSKSPNWKEYQWKIKVRRRCKERGYIFNGWKGEYKGAQTKLQLYNPTTDNSWHTTNINNFINNGRGDPVFADMNKGKHTRRSSESYIADFKATGKFIEGTEFTRISAKKWTYTCPVCSNDEYVKAGVCSGIFNSLTANLLKGDLSCRCSTRYTPNEEFRLYQINKIMEGENYTFLGWKDGYKNGKSKFNWLCSYGHSCCTSVEKFIIGRRCPTCNEGSYGYYRRREDEMDTLYILKVNLPYFKVGRTFEPERRLYENQKRLNNYYGKNKYTFTTEFSFKAPHKTIFNLEQILIGIDRDSLYNLDRPEDTYGSSELIKNKYYEEVVEFCKDYIDEWWK